MSAGWGEPDLFAAADVALHVMKRQDQPIAGLEAYAWLSPVYLWVCGHCGYICTGGDTALMHEALGLDAPNL